VNRALTAASTAISVNIPTNGIIDITAASITKVLEDNASTLGANGNDFYTNIESTVGIDTITGVDHTGGVYLYANITDTYVDNATILKTSASAEILRGSYDVYVPAASAAVANNQRLVLPIPNAANGQPVATQGLARARLTTKSIPYGIVRYASYAEVLP